MIADQTPKTRYLSPFSGLPVLVKWLRTGNPGWLLVTEPDGLQYVMCPSLTRRTPAERQQLLMVARWLQKKQAMAVFVLESLRECPELEKLRPLVGKIEPWSVRD